MSKLKCLKKIFGSFGSYPPPANGIADQKYMNSSPLARGKLNIENGYTYGVKREAASALHDLADLIYTDKQTPKYRKGCTFKEMSDALFDVVMEFFDQSPANIDANTVASIDGRIDSWFNTSTTTTRPFIPCDITPYYVSSFAIGPVSFTHVDDFVQSIKERIPFAFMLHQMLEAMAQHAVCWIAELEIVDCSQKRADEIGNLTVDLALAVLQLILPSDNYSRVGRLNARRTPSINISVSLTQGNVTSGSRNQQPGRTISGEAFADILKANKDIIESLSNRVNAFLSGHITLPRLNESWSDAAYWFHEGIAEPLDTLAVPKLETAIEVLLRAVNSKGSETRINQAIRTFYGLEPDQFLAPDSLITVKQFSKSLVSDRSRLLHGTLSTLATDMRASRSSLTALTHELLVHFSVELDHYEAAGQIVDDIDPFLDWIVARRNH